METVWALVEMTNSYIKQWAGTCELHPVGCRGSAPAKWLNNYYYSFLLESTEMEILCIEILKYAQKWPCMGDSEMDGEQLTVNHTMWWVVIFNNHQMFQVAARWHPSDPVTLSGIWKRDIPAAVRAPAHVVRKGNPGCYKCGFITAAGLMKVVEVLSGRNCVVCLVRQCFGQSQMGCERLGLETLQRSCADADSQIFLFKQSCWLLIKPLPPPTAEKVPFLELAWASSHIH